MSNQSPALFGGPVYDPPDMSRAWAIANQSLRPDEQGDVVAKLAGAVMGGRDLGEMLVDRFNSGERDVVYLLPGRLLVVVASSSSSNGRALRVGAVGHAASVLSVERRDVTAINCPGRCPPGLRMLNSGVFAQFEVIWEDGHRGTLDFWVDATVTVPEEFGRVAADWLAADWHEADSQVIESQYGSLEILADQAVVFLDEYLDDALDERATKTATRLFELISLRAERLGKSELLNRVDREELSEWIEGQLVQDESFRAAVASSVPRY